MKLTHLLVAGTALVSATALAAGEKKDSQAQDSQSGKSSQMSQPSSSAGASSKGAQAAGQDKETIKKVQQKLTEQGHDAGQADGVMGPKTQQALKEFQQKNQLQATGKIDQETLAELGVESGSSSMGSSSSKGASGQSSSGSAGASGGGSGAAAGSSGATGGSSGGASGGSEKAK